MHEILTLQFGQQSNHLGTHFWNTQESYFTYPPEEESPVDHDIHFKPGIAPDGSDTYTPRTLIYDLKGAFGSMRKINALYEAPSENDDPIVTSSVWSSTPTVHRQPPISPSPYQIALNTGSILPTLSPSSVRYWSDYSHLYYHPKSIIQLSEFDVNDTLMPFEDWDVGMQLFEKLEREADLVDRDFRPFIEECDGLQGIQIYTGVGDAWGGWSSGWIERLRDELGKKSVWVWGVGGQGSDAGVSRKKRMQQLVNSARTLDVMGEQASVYVPMSQMPKAMPGYLRLDGSSAWHIAALQCMAAESLSIPSRLRASQVGRASLQQLEETMNQTGKRRIAKLELSIADPEALKEKMEQNGQPKKSSSSQNSGWDDEDGQERNLAAFDIDVFTHDYRAMPRTHRKKEHDFGRVETKRGAWGTPQPMEPRSRFDDGPTFQSFDTPLLFPMLSSFPSIVNIPSRPADKLAVHAGLTTSTAVAEQIRNLERIAGRLVGLEEREALSNGLMTMAEEYDEGWDSGSDSENWDD